MLFVLRHFSNFKKCIFQLLLIYNIRIASGVQTTSDYVKTLGFYCKEEQTLSGGKPSGHREGGKSWVKGEAKTGSP